MVIVSRHGESANQRKGKTMAENKTNGQEAQALAGMEQLTELAEDVTQSLDWKARFLGLVLLRLLSVTQAPAVGGDCQ